MSDQGDELRRMLALVPASVSRIARRTRRNRERYGLDYPDVETVVWMVARRLWEDARRGVRKSYRADLLVREAERRLGVGAPASERRGGSLAERAGNVATLEPRASDDAELRGWSERLGLGDVLEKLSARARVVFAADFLHRAWVPGEHPGRAAQREELACRELGLDDSELSGYMSENRLGQHGLDRDAERTRRRARHRKEYERKVRPILEAGGWPPAATGDAREVNKTNEVQNKGQMMSRLTRKLSNALGLVVLGTVILIGGVGATRAWSAERARGCESATVAPAVAGHGQMRSGDLLERPGHGQTRSVASASLGAPSALRLPGHGQT